MTYVEPGGSSLEKRRPLSPHLQIYRPMLTMMMSITHRITGAVLYLGTLLLAWLLIAASTGPDAYAAAVSCVNSIPGKLILVRFHLGLVPSSSGWNTSRPVGFWAGFAHPQREWLAQATLIGGIVLTAGVWGIAYLVS